MELLARLELSRRAWIVVDHWDADLHAIGIAHREDPRRLVYISTFDEPPDTYYFECEVPTGPDETDYESGHSKEHVSFAELRAAMEAHLQRRAG